MSDSPHNAERKLSQVEQVKEASRYLFHILAEEVGNDQPAFSEKAVQVLKHHGTYQQDDRDKRRGAGGKAYMMMVRVKVPGGVLTAEQLLAQLDLCDELGNTTARITDRQDLQLHGILKSNLREAIRRVNEVQMTTLGACGDVVRNVICCPAPLRHNRVREELQELTRAVTRHLLPRTPAYHQIWLTDPDTLEKQLVGGQADEDEIEPIYGKTYLPRKFKIAFGLTDDNCVDIYANDLGFLAIVEQGQIVGFNVLAGGSLGVTPSNKNTFPALAKPIGFITKDEVIPIAEAVVKIFRDFGERGDRKRARLKYLIADRGVEWFRATLEQYYGRAIRDPLALGVEGFDDHIGWYEQGDGRWFYGLNVENGRILDREGFRLKSALREICRRFRPGIRFTTHQSILLCDLPEEARPELEAILRDHGVPLSEQISMVRRWSMACVALPTCPLAVTESERVLPGLIDALEKELARLGLEEERFTVRMTGCPNGCARPYNADIGLVGRTVNKYAIYLGGRLLGDRLGELYLDTVPLQEIVPRLRPVLELFARQRQNGETLGDFCWRLGMETLRKLCVCESETVIHSATGEDAETC